MFLELSLFSISYLISSILKTSTPNPQPKYTSPPTPRPTPNNFNTTTKHPTNTTTLHTNTEPQKSTNQQLLGQNPSNLRHLILVQFSVPKRKDYAQNKNRSSPGHFLNLPKPKAKLILQTILKTGKHIFYSHFSQPSPFSGQSQPAYSPLS